MQTLLSADVERTILKMQKEQNCGIQEERLLVNRLGKVDHLVSDLHTQHQTQQQETAKLQSVMQDTLQKLR